jgi:hypothetical protein
MIKTFIFKQSNKANWYQIRDQLTATLNDIFRRVSFGDYKEDFEIEIKKICKKRSGSQLKAFWLLISVVRKYFNSFPANNYTDEQVAEYFKRAANHVTKIAGETVGKSIANKSDCTVEDMERIINTILQFGANHGIKNCYIEPRDLQDLLNNFR